MKTISKILTLTLSLLAGCASTGGFSERGSIVMSGQQVRAFAAGPSVVHAYAQGSGGRVFVAQSVTGTDADCASALARNRTSTPLPGDRVDEVTLERGMVACIATSSSGRYELVWHARPGETQQPAQQLAMVQRR